MKSIRISLIITGFIFSFLLIKCTVSGVNEEGEDPQNIILFIGDGMGLAHLTSAMSSSGSPLHITEMPVVGLSKTSSSNKYITDSAAGGTAIATGVKTNNKLIGLDSDSIKVESILEIAHRNGMSTGVITTTSVTSATPAAFVAHNISRNNHEEIAIDFTKGTVDIFMGGGLRYFTERKDSADLIGTLKQNGYEIVTSLEELNSTKSSRFAGLFAGSDMPYAIEGRPVSLAIMTRKAISVLSKNEKGFFLMVEGSLIDYSAHDADTQGVISEILDMDEAVGEALSFASGNRNTLVIVTADHEAGGMALTDGNLNDRSVVAEFATEGHTAIMVPVFTAGAGSEKFNGVMENTEIFERMMRALGIK